LTGGRVLTKTMGKVAHTMFQSLREYYMRMHASRPETSKDLYIYMLAVEVVFFFLLIIFFPYYSASTSDSLSSLLQENRVPIRFFLALFIQFCLIIIDRMIYLRSSLKGKFWLQLMSVLVTHLFIFFVYPLRRGEQLFQSDDGDIVLLVCYLLKCTYFYISALQIQYGYPPFMKQEYMMKDVGIIGLSRFMVYRSIPFAFEVKTTLDWLCTNSPLNLYDWLKLEDIHANLFMIECDLRLRKSMDRKRGDLYPLVNKVLIGGATLLLISLLIWGPFMVYITGVPIGEAKPVENVQVKLSLDLPHGSFELLELSALSRALNFSFDEIHNHPNSSLTKFAEDDDLIQWLELAPHSMRSWDASPPTLALLISALGSASKSSTSSVPPTLSFSFRFIRPDQSFSNKFIHQLSPEEGQGIASILASLASSSSSAFNFTVLPSLYPFVFRLLPNGGVVALGEQHIDCALQVHRQANQQWWSLSALNVPHPLSNQTEKNNENDGLPTTSSSGLSFYILADKTFGSLFSSAFSSYSIITLYVTFVFSVSRFLRIYVLGMSARIIYENIPDVTFVKDLCHDVYSARWDREHELEEQMFGQLIQLYRSPEMLLTKTVPSAPMHDITTWPEQDQAEAASRPRHES